MNWMSLAMVVSARGNPTNMDHDHVIKIIWVMLSNKLIPVKKNAEIEKVVILRLNINFVCVTFRILIIVILVFLYLCIYFFIILTKNL